MALKSSSTSSWYQGRMFCGRHRCNMVTNMVKKNTSHHHLAGLMSTKRVLKKRQWLVWVVPVGWQPCNQLQQGWSFPSTLWRMEEQVTREIWSIWASSLTVHRTWTGYARSLPPCGYKRLWSIYFQIIDRIVCRISTIMKLQTSIGLQLRKDGSLWRWKMGVKHQWMYMRCQEWKLWTLWWEMCWMEGWLVLADLIGMGNPCLIFSLVNS